MFHLITGLYAQYNSKTTLNVLLVGPSEAGKTSFIERLKLDHRPSRTAAGRTSTTTTTTRAELDQRVFDLDLPSTRLKLHFWDLGGAPQLRRIWAQYYEEADLLIYMVDGTRWEELGRDEIGLPSTTKTGANGTASGKGKGKEVVRGLSDDEAREDSWEALRSTASSLGDLPLLILVNKLDEPSSSSSTATYEDDDDAAHGLSSADVGKRRRGEGDADAAPTPSYAVLEAVRSFFQERIAKLRAQRLEDRSTLDEGPRSTRDDVDVEGDEGGGKKRRRRRSSAGLRGGGGAGEESLWEDVDVLGVSALDGNGVTHAMEWLKSRALSIQPTSR